MTFDTERSFKLLQTVIPNFDQERVRLREWGPSGFTIAMNIAFRGPEFLVSEYAAEWLELYQERNFFYVDPVLVWTFANSGSCRWSDIDLPDVRSVMKAAKSYGLEYGVAISRKTGTRRSFLTIARADREFTDTEIQVISAKFDTWAEIVLAQPELTEGELDVLQCLSNGLTQRGIAEELGISESAVKQRSLKACSKLNAKTRTQAVAIAVARSFIKL